MGAVELKDADIKRGSATGDGSTVAYAIGWIPPNEQSMFITINGVMQQDAAYTISSSTLTFAAAPASADAIEWRGIQSSGTIVTPADGTVGESKLADEAVVVAKLATTGTPTSSTFLSGTMAWAAAGLSGWSEDGADNDLLPDSASAGIYLGVNSATAANLLDDYETGTWTCTFSNANAQTGYYVKVGNLCHVSAKISTSGGASGTSFGGLPFTTASSDDYRSSGGVGYQNSTSGVWNPLTNSSNTTFGFFIADASQEMGSTGKTTYFSITYPTS